MIDVYAKKETLRLSCTSFVCLSNEQLSISAVNDEQQLDMLSREVVIDEAQP